jgi:PAS domain S-box-containing protein
MSFAEPPDGYPDFAKIGILRDAARHAEPHTDREMVVASKLMHALSYESDRRRSSATAQSAPGASDLDMGSLFDRVLDAVVVADLTTGRIVLWNPAAEKLFGYAAEEAIGKSIEILMPEAIAPLHRAGLERYRRTGHGLIIDAEGPVEMPARMKGGEEIRVELALSELQNPSGERFSLAVARDAMHRKQLELTNLELAQAHVAHTEAEIALVERDDLLEAVSATLESDPSADELQRLAHVLAEFRRLHRGELRVHTTEADLVDVVHAASDAARRRAAGRRLLVHTPPRATASFDSARFRQVLDQVLDQAILCTGEGAKIEIHVEQLAPPRHVQVTVRAHGNVVRSVAAAELQLCRTLMQQQRGTLVSDVSASGSLEVVMTLRGSPQSVKRRPSRARTAGRTAPIS